MGTAYPGSSPGLARGWGELSEEFSSPNSEIVSLKKDKMVDWPTRVGSMSQSGLELGEPAGGRQKPTRPLF